MTSSPYQSKVLNFVATKYRQILNRSDATWRHLKFAATNTVQLLLYPIYVLLQTSRLTLKQLRQTTITNIPQITEKVNKKVSKKVSKNHQTPDKPIQERLLISTQADPKLLEPSSPRMQWEDFSGLEIVKNHKVSDISTKIKQKNPLILQTAKIEKNVRLQLQPCAELVPIFGHLGGIWHIMAWVQTSKIALWFNLFEESNIALDQNKPKHDNRNFTSYQSQPLLSSSNLTVSEFIHNLGKQYLYPITRGLGLNGLLLPFNIEEEWELESLLEAELGQENQQKPLATQHKTPTVASLVSPCQPGTFQLATSLTTKPVINPGAVEKLGKEKNCPLHQDFSQEKISNSHNSPKKEAIAFKEVFRDIDGHTIEQEINYSINSTKISVQTYNSQSRPKHQANWLEVESVSVGYVKHPLQIILEWVDVIMTWLEKLVAQVWQLCQQKLKNF
ncbi:hypothetical protein [Hydrocoleum sp. CS-953]|uniref:hypothetical protein n=1 Tax=Microcoleaceae TaxID=1892252 RepID=UPI000B9C633A|nr:hypothetical protein [Hydrocoleum sp. CS-953]OZH51913.1 hypothetical protein AFK68_27785 [Hydrocoleum sp. CS-953]